LSRAVSIRFTDEVFKLIDSCSNNRSSFVRDACLAHAQEIGKLKTSFILLSKENSDKLKRFSAQLNIDHAKLVNVFLEELFKKAEGDPLFTKRY